MVEATNKLRPLLFLTVFLLPLRVIIWPISTVWDSLSIFIPFALIILLAYYPSQKPKPEKVGKEIEATLKQKQTFYFIRIIERVKGQKSYYIFCAVVSAIAFVIGYRLSVVNLLLTDPMSALYVHASSSISLFLGFALWKPVTEGFSELVKGFCKYYEKREKEEEEGKDTSRVASALLYHNLMFDVLFPLVWGAFWSFLIICWIGFPSTLLPSIYDAFGVGLQYFVQSTTIAISALSIFAVFKIGRASSILVVEETSIFRKRFGEFFENLEKFVLKVAVMQLLVPGLIMPNIVVFRDFYEQYGIGIAVGVFWFIFGQLAVLFLGICGAHIAMKKLKKRKKKELEEKMIEKKGLLQTTSKDSFLYISTLLDYRLLILQNEYLESMSTWPISVKGGIGFITLLLGTLINILRDYLVELFL